MTPHQQPIQMTGPQAYNLAVLAYLESPFATVSEGIKAACAAQDRTALARIGAIARSHAGDLSAWNIRSGEDAMPELVELENYFQSAAQDCETYSKPEASDDAEDWKK